MCMLYKNYSDLIQKKKLEKPRLEMYLEIYKFFKVSHIVKYMNSFSIIL